MNSVTKINSFPVTRVENCIDNIGHAKYVTIFDLLKRFLNISLTDREEISAFVTPDGLYQYKVMSSVIKKSPAALYNVKLT